MRKKLFDTTFGKLTVAYVFLGVIPLLLLSVLFFSRFTDSVRAVSYTHLDVYKRQAKYSAMSPGTENGLLGEHIVPLPTSIGYAMAAEVIEVGEGVEDLKVGDHVVATVEHAQYVVCLLYTSRCV